MRALCVALVLLGALCAATAHAAEADAKSQARAHFRAGTAFFEVGNYDRAIEEFSAAHRLLPLPDFWFNLGQAYRLKGDLTQAADFYQRFLGERPTGPLSDEAREHLGEIELARKAAPATPIAPTDTPPPTVATPTATPATVLVTAAPPPPRKRKLWVWGVVAGAAVALGVGLGLGLGLSTTNGHVDSTLGTVHPF